MCNTAETESNDSENERFSTTMIEQLLLDSGHSSRVLDIIKQRGNRKKKSQ